MWNKRHFYFVEQSSVHWANFRLRRAAYEHSQNRQNCCIYIPVAVGKTMNKQPQEGEAALG